MVNNWLNIIQDYVLPPTCILCGSQGFDSQDICKPCFSELSKNIHCCYKCAETFKTANTKPQLCGRCISHTPAFDKSHVPFMHIGVMRYLISTLKFNRQFKNARLLGYLLANHLKTAAKMPELIIPVPLHKSRLKERGFNQAIEIAKNLSKELQIPLDSKSCIRFRDTPHQIDLPAKLRQKNIKNAFKIKKSIKAQHVAIVDDVMTTGSTVNELAKTLKKSGVVKVDIWVCTRA